MKKLLPILAGCLLAGSTAFAQTPGDGTTPETAIGTPSPWVLTVNRTQPEATITYYYIPKTDNKKGNDDIYSLDVVLPNVEHGWQQSCYYLTATYTAEDGTQTNVVFTTGQSANNGSRYDLPFGDSDVSLIVSTWGTNNAAWSIKEYTLCDSKWTAFGYFSGNTVGNKSQRIYFYNPTEKSLISRYFGGNAGGDATIGTLYVTGANPAGTFAVNQSNIANPGINTAIIDYTTGVIEIEAVYELPVYIDGITAFVAPTSLNLPANVKAYEIDKYDDGNVYLKAIESSEIEAFQPVILTADTPGEYKFEIPADAVYNHEDVLYYKDKDTKYLKDAEMTVGDFTFCGVNQFHNLPVNSYVLSENGFALNTATKQIVNPFTGYLKYTGSEDAPESISIIFPEEEEPAENVLYIHFTNAEGTYSSTHSETLSWDASINKYLNETVSMPSSKEASEEEVLYFVLSDAKPAVAILSNYTDWAGYGNVYVSDGNDGVSKLTEGVDVTPFEATPGYVHSIELTLGEDGEPTAVTVQSTGTTTVVNSVAVASENGAIYNIFGQKVDESYKGIVIRNGKKYIQR